MRGKRGQFTIFVILGIVLVVVFAFLLAARNLVQTNNLQSEADANVKEAIAGSRINYFVETCIDRVTDDALELLALQGGVLYESQGGLIPNPEFLGEDYLYFNVTELNNGNAGSIYNYTNITYGIIKNTNHTCVYQAPEPWPFPNTTLETIRDKYYENIVTKDCEDNSGAFGIYNLSKLCDKNGTNKLNVTGNISVQYRTCFGDQYADNFSIQEQLQEYISNKTVACVDGFKIFEEKGYNITVVNNPITDVTYGKGQITVQTNYPFKTTVKGREYTSYYVFEVKKRNYLKELYEEYLYYLLQQEYQNIYFNIDVFYRQSSDKTVSEWGWNHTQVGYNPDITLKHFRNSCLNLSSGVFHNCSDGTFDDVIQIIDNRSLIRGRPLVFNFAIENRPPVLQWYDTGFAYNVVVKEGDLINLTPFAIDPDETAVLYNYSDWKETTDEYFNETCCVANIDECRENPKFCIVQIPNTEPHNWTNSSDFILTQQNATYKTNHSDLGLHHTAIWVEDEEGLYDYQNISIMVFDEPNVQASSSHLYVPDITATNASIEDPFLLNGKVFSYFTNINYFSWNDSVEEEVEFIIDTEKNDTWIPLNINISDMDNLSWHIERMLEPIYSFQKYLDPNHFHNITLVAYYLDPATGDLIHTTPDLIEIEVNQCVPYRGEKPVPAGKLAAAPYPYNFWAEDDDFNNYTDNVNPFLANHSCCNNDSIVGLEWGQVIRETDDLGCYDYTGYGAIKNINLTLFNRDPYSPGITETWDTILISGKMLNYYLLFETEKLNDIFKRTFIRNCDGSRGNICNGTYEQTLTLEEECEQDISLDEFCSGPNSNYKNFGEKPTNLGCVNYTKTTFQKEFDIEIKKLITLYPLETETNPATGSCNYEEKCSGIGTGQYGNGGQNYCNATCNGDGTCTRTMNALCDLCSKNDIEAIDYDNQCSGDPVCIKQIAMCEEKSVGICTDGSGCGSTSSSNKIDYFKDSGWSVSFFEYRPVDRSSPSDGTNETCFARGPYANMWWVGYNPDDFEGVCKLGITSDQYPLWKWDSQWNAYPHRSNCCGDDISDKYIESEDLPYGIQTSCCRSNDFCTYNNECYLKNEKILSDTYMCGVSGDWVYVGP